MSLNRPIWKLRDWIDVEILHWNFLSFNPNAINLLKENPENINWCILSNNKNAIEMLENNKENINWR